MKILIPIVINLFIVNSLQNGQCPKYKCLNSTSSNCIISDNSTIYVKKCSTNQTCCEIYSSSTSQFTGTCVKKQFDATRYPGEDCETSQDCIGLENVFSGKCTNKKCEGITEGGKSNYTDYCVVGLYSNGTHCVQQENKGSKCTTAYDCKNTYLCYDSKCIDYFSLTGTDFNKAKLPDFSALLACEYGESNFEGTSCIKKDFSSNFKAKANSDGYVECNLGDDCEYTDGIRTYNESVCSCGNNEEGKAYCKQPVGQCNYIFCVNFI